MRKTLSLIAALAVLGACDRSKAELESTIAELQAVSAQKDSLVQEVMATTQFVGDLTTDLAAVRALSAGRPVAAEAAELEGKTPAQTRAVVRERVKELTTRLQQSEERLTQSRARVQSLGAANADLRQQLAAYDSTITSLYAVLATQKVEIAALGEEVAGLQRTTAALTEQRDDLAVQREQLAQKVDEMTAASNRAYYVVGTEADLLARGVIVKRGGLLGIGKTPVPAPTLDAADFVAIDKMRDSVIMFPKPDKAYRVISLQDTKYLEVPPNKDNELRTGLRIASPEQFWAGSRYLILMEK